MAGKGRPTLADDIAAALAIKLPWKARLPQEAVAEVDEVRTRFREGKLPKQPYLIATRIIECGKARGWDLPSDKVLVRWLRADD